MADFDVAVIGAGPGGYTAAIRAAQLGMRAAVIEKDNVGGLCLNWGCIPSKALLHAAEIANLLQRGDEFGFAFDNLTLDMSVAVNRSRDVVAKFVAGVETLLKQNKVTLLRGAAKLVDAHTLQLTPSGETVSAENIIAATGARTRALPNLPVDGERIITSREALERRKTPASIVIVGGGPIGAEFGYFYHSYGAEVTIVELLERLVPNEDEDIGKQLERSFKSSGIAVRTGTKVESVERNGDGVLVTVSVGDKQEQIEAECVLVGVGFAPHQDMLGLADAGVELRNGWIKVDGHGRTNVPGIWAVGDCTGELLLAHVAAHQAVTAIETIAGHDVPALDYVRMPRAVYCQPQIASIGLTETQARERGFDVRTGRFPFRANGKAMALGETDGFAKIIADRATGKLLGCHLIGNGVTELSGEASLGTLLDTTVHDVATAVHAHPTLSEALKEAALALTGEAIHFYAPKRDA